MEQMVTLKSGIQQSESLSIIKFRIFFAHVASLGIFLVPVTNDILLYTVLSYFIRVFAWEAGSHRYFSHRSYKTSRPFQLFLAVLAASGGQRGPLWWAWHHRMHHKYSDRPEDPHSPVQHNFWFAHLGWCMDRRYIDTDLDAVSDLVKYPELVWVNKYHYLFPYLLMAIIFLIGQYTSIFGGPGMGISAVIWIFFFSMVLSLHATFVVNTLMHGRKINVFNLRRYDIDDTTTNSWLWSVPTMGAAWHNNHHRYMNSARAGFYWWELDLTYLVLKFLSIFRIVWDLKPVPKHILEEGRLSRDRGRV